MVMLPAGEGQDQAATAKNATESAAPEPSAPAGSTQFMWPLIFKANRAKIKNANLIYPGQVFDIPRTFSLDDAKAARHKAGKSKKRSAPESKANLPADLREALGYGF